MAEENKNTESRPAENAEKKTYSLQTVTANVKWRPADTDLSQLPERYLEAVIKAAGFIEFKDSDTPDMVTFTYPISLCNIRDFKKRTVTDVDSQKETLNWKIKQWATADGSKQNLRDMKVCYESDRKKRTCPFNFATETKICIVLHAAYYKYLQLCDKKEYERQRAEYRKNKNAIDAKHIQEEGISYLPIREYPHMPLSRLDDYLCRIDKWEKEVYEVFDNDTKIKIKDYNDDDGSGAILKDTISGTCQTQSWENYVNRFKNIEKNKFHYSAGNYKYLNKTWRDICIHEMLLQLIREGKIGEYKEQQKKWQKTVSASLKGNSYFFMVTGNDREEVRSCVKAVNDNITVSFNLPWNNYIHMTLYELAMFLTPEENDFIDYGHLAKDFVYVITGVREFLKIKGTNSGINTARRVDYVLKEFNKFDDRVFLIFAGEKDEMDDLLNAVPELRFLLGDNIRHIDDYTSDQITSMCLQIIGESAAQAKKRGEKISLTRKDKTDLKEWLDENMGSFPVKNGALARYIADYIISRGKFALPANVSQVKRKNFMDELQSLVGMGEIKDRVMKLYKTEIYKRTLAANGITVAAAGNHMIFTGNPGTGKTTVARILARALFDAGVIKKNTLVETDREGLVGQYIGQTAPKTKEVIDRAMGGVLFIDEAYALTASGSSDDYGQEAIATLIKAMEDNRDRFVVIFAGYKKEMGDFIDANPGIASRIAYTMHFTDYDENELTEIYMRKAQRSGFTVNKEAKKAVLDRMRYFKNVKNFGNGRFVEKLYSETIQKKALLNNGYTEIAKADIPTVEEIIRTMPDGENMQLKEDVSADKIRAVAVHEAGHAVINEILYHKRIKRIAIDETGSGKDLGYVDYEPSSARMSTKADHTNAICRAMGGLAAEKIILGEYRNGGESDIQKARIVALAYLKAFGSADGEFYMLGDDDPDMIRDAKALIRREFDRAVELLTEYRDKIDIIADTLLKSKTISRDQFESIMKK